jgi:hypothetical protein
MTDELPRRPRRKLVTPLTAALAAVLIAALGFIGGVQVQKSSAGSSATFSRARTGGFTPTGGSGGSSDATVGTIADVDGKTLYVKDSSGTTVRVKTTSDSKVTRTAVSKVGAVHPGDTVMVQGTKSSGGTVTATSVTATAKNATSGLAGLFRGGPQTQTQEGNDG